MGVVSDALASHIKELVERHSIVVWFDPDQEYDEFINKLSFGEVQIFCYEHEVGFLSLRRQLEDLWSAETPPQLILYVPLNRSETQYALVEYTTVGAALEPGRQPPDWNTRLAVVAKRALQDILPAAAVSKLVDEVESGQLDLEDLDQLAERQVEVHAGALALVFGTGDAEEIALRFLTDPSIDAEIERRDADQPLVDFLGKALGTEFELGTNLEDLRARLARYILSNEFLASLESEPPERLSALPRPSSKAALKSVAQIVKGWRQRRDLAESYRSMSQRVEQELSIGKLKWPLEAIESSQTFARLEQVLQSDIEERLSHGRDGDVSRIIRERMAGYWSLEDPVIKLRWQLIGEAAEVLQFADEVKGRLNEVPSGAAEMVKAYSEGDAPWYRLDKAHRCLERDFHSMEIDTSKDDSLLRLVAVARQRHAEVTNQMAVAFIKAYQADNFEISDVMTQARVFHDFVESALEEGTTAYILVDALRYEMARDLIDQLDADWGHEIQAALATPPSITEVGMGAMMPDADRGLSIEPASKGKVGVRINDALLRNREERLEHLRNQVPQQVEVVKLHQLAPLTDKKLRDKLSETRLIVVTAADEIDGLWERDPSMARRLHDDVFSQLRRGLRTLFGIGVGKVVVVSDHGFLFGQELGAGELIDSPGGDTACLKRRVWLGKGGEVREGCLRAHVSDFGLGGDLELLTPYGTAAFKVAGGSMEYFHGGLSLQELVVPVLVVTSGGVSPDLEEPAFTWRLSLGSERITTRFCSVTVEGNAEQLFEEPPRIRVEIRAGDEVVSIPVSSSYGYDEATRDVVLEFEGEGSTTIKLNTITLQVTEQPEQDSVDVLLIDSDTGVSLEKIDGVPIDIAL